MADGRHLAQVPALWPSPPAQSAVRHDSNLPSLAVLGTNCRAAKSQRLVQLLRQQGQAKAPPKQWAAMIKALSQKGVKAAELEEKEKLITEDDSKSLKEAIQELTKKFESSAADMARNRETEVMEN